MVKIYNDDTGEFQLSLHQQRRVDDDQHVDHCGTAAASAPVVKFKLESHTNVLSNAMHLIKVQEKKLNY